MALEREILGNGYISGDSIDTFSEVLRATTNYSPFSVYLIGALEQVPNIVEGLGHIQIMSLRSYNQADVISHWICTYFDGTSVRIYDSLNSRILTPEQNAFLLRLFPQNPPIIFESVQQQHNNIDCGVYAIAFATSIALGRNPCYEKYCVPEMRNHLFHMLSANVLLPFRSQYIIPDDPNLIRVETESGLDASSEMPLPSPPVKRKGRPLKVKRGRPKLSDKTREEQVSAAKKKYTACNPKVNRDAVTRYTKKNPEVHRDAVVRYTQNNPEVHRDAVTRYSQSNPEVNIQAAKRYRDENTESIQNAKRAARAIPVELRTAIASAENVGESIIAPASPVAVLSPAAEPLPISLASLSIIDVPASVVAPTLVSVPAPIIRTGVIGSWFGQQLTEVKAILLKNLSLLSADVKRCKHCNAAFFNEEIGRKKWCCGEGKLHSEKLPAIVAAVYSRQEFLKKIRSFNHIFSFSALQMTGSFQNPATGTGFVKMQGRIYHQVSDLSVTGHGNNISSMYIVDGEDREQIGQQRRLNRQIVESVLSYLRTVNPLISSLRMLSRHTSDEAHIVFQATNRRTDGPVLGDMPNCKEIAGILRTTLESAPKQVVIWKIGTSKPHTVPYLSPTYEPLQYPLLFPHATAGWSLNMLDKDRKKITQVRFYRYRWFSEERFTYLRRLGQEYIVDMWCKIEEERLQFLRQPQQQRALRIATRAEFDETIAGNVDPVNVGKVFLPSSFTNGPRYMLAKYLNSMAVVCRLGNPSFFLTVTCNPHWQEIKDSLYPGQSFYDRPDLCVRVFYLKLAKLLALLKNGTLFGPIVSLQYVIEFQKRGLPHAHIVFRVAGGGPTNSVEIDSFVRATIPSRDEAGGRLRELVLKHMVHGPCGIANVNCPCMDPEKRTCTKMFPKAHCEITHIDANGRIIYKRPSSGEQHILENGRTITNQWIVPYNAAVLLLMEGHCNLEDATTSHVIKYLYKYLHKGPDHAKASVMANLNADNEIEQYSDYRYISASEALWRLFDNGICFCSPAVISLPVHLPNRDSIIFRPGDNLDATVGSSYSKLQIYMSRPAIPELIDLTFLDFYESYNVDAKARASATVPVIPHPNGKHYLTKRIRGKLVARVNFISPSLGELFYLRMLLIRFACDSYESLRTVNGETYSTFQEAAHAHGLLNDENEYRETLREASAFKTGRQLRRLFFSIIIFGGPALLLWEEFKDFLCDDFLRKDRAHPERAYAFGLTALDRMLRMHGRTLEDMGLPETVDTSNEIGREQVRWNVTSCEQFVDQWEPQLSSEQRTIYSYVLALLSESSQQNLKRAIFVDGPAGTGKTVLLNTITAKLRSMGHIVLCTATTGIAALNYEGGITAHSMFKLPLNDLTGTGIMNVSGRSERAELLKAATVIILDEAPMAHRFLIECLHRGLGDICQSTELFGGKIVILAGDFRQISPIVVNGTISDVVAASLRKSNLWSAMQKMSLKTSHRSHGDPAYAAFILKVGEDKIPSKNIGGVRTIALKGIVVEPSVESLLRYVYPDNILKDPDLCCRRAILSGTNLNISEINALMLNRLAGDCLDFYSADSAVHSNVLDPTEYLGTELLNRVSSPGVPDHLLSLKIGSVVMLIRNLSFEDRLVNGTKLIVTSTSRLIIQVRFPNSQEIHLIPRIPFKFTVQRNGMEMTRQQFPLKLAYALTINKAQGQTLDCIGVDLRSDVFSHGQLYVALGRVRTQSSIRVVVHPDRIIRGVAYVANIVYPDLLSSPTRN